MSADPLSQVRIDLRHASRVMRTNGLMQRNYCDYDQAIADNIPFGKARVCTQAAVHVAISGDPLPVGYDKDPRILAATDHLRNYLMDHYANHGVIDWNDEPGRTTGQAALMLYKAAAWTPPAPLAIAK